ncbi:MAG: bifunctional DNA-formamidopyrimidine glycosylase/DNA-(apurinic or apyrimidinic site) lyase [Gemmatimonadales bacterium]|nr:MAG: bifunctional DNA-formamidopyrimidine glycosylase/DNA-(apurinic or apyrimidinic site) lyase [Gemmatimonadales bacterium]
MPELPEVETIRRDLAPALEGKAIASVRIRKPDILMDGDCPRQFASSLHGRRISSVERRGKNLLIHLASLGRMQAAVLQVQVRMTGRFAVAPDSDPGGRLLAERLKFRHVAAQFELDDGRTVLYDDVRRLGGFRLLTTEAWQAKERELGSEPLEANYTARALARDLAHGRAPIKNALLDQRRVAGVGNIYASEALHRARLDPTRACDTLDEMDMRRLHRGLRAVLSEALREAGTTLRDYRTVNGSSGKYQDRLRVYDREGERCPRCGTTIRRVLQAGRSSFFCPGCQI